MAAAEMSLQREWRTWRTASENEVRMRGENTRDEDGWMDMSEKAEEQGNLEEKRVEEEGPKQLQESAQKSEMADDDGNDGDDEDDDVDNNEDEFSVHFHETSANSDSLVAVFANNNEASGGDDDDGNDGDDGDYEDVDYDNDEFSVNFPGTFANSDSLVAVFANNNEASGEDDAVKHDEDNNDDNDEDEDDNNDKKCVVDTSTSTDDICGCKADPENDLSSWTLKEQQMTDSSCEQALIINQESGEVSDEEEEDEEEESYGNCSDFEDSDDEECDMGPRKLYSDPAYPGDLFQTLEEMRLKFLLTDLILSTEDGLSLHTHSLVLAAVSSLVQQKLQERDEGEREMSLSLASAVCGLGLAAVVEFAYTGTISTLNKDNTAQIQTAAVILGASRVLELCNEEERREPEKTGGKNKDKKQISAKEQISINLQCIRLLWAEMVGCDVELVVEGRVFHAHRVLLAASSGFFRGMFTSGMRESQQESVSLLLVRAAEFEALLHCAYSGALTLGWGCVFELTCTSLQLQFHSALSICLNFLQQEMDAYTCLDVASFAEAYGMHDLLGLADDFVLRNFPDVSSTPKFQDLPVEKLQIYLQSNSLCVPSELPVFKAVMSWIEAYPRRRVRLAKDLMGTIQFPLMTFKEFIEVKSITSWPRIGASNLYESLLKEFCSNSSNIQSNFRAYLPKDTLVLVGGERITDNFDKRRICREMWFSNSFQNHVGLVKKIEWRMLGSLPEKPRYSHGVGVIRGKLYVVGGRHFYGKDDTMRCAYRYDPLQNSWQKLADMHESRGSFTLVVLNDKIYAIGGERDSEVNIESVEEYCLNTNSWRFVHPLDKALCCHAASVWNGEIHLSGGFNSQYQCLPSMILYHPERGSTYLTEMSHDRAQHCMETLGDRLYVAGGVSSGAKGQLVDQLACEVFDPAENSWSDIMPLTVPHVGSASAVLEGKIYVIGGYCHEDYSDTKSVHRYDPVTERWENMSVTPGPNTYIAACVLPVPAQLRQ